MIFPTVVNLDSSSRHHGNIFSLSVSQWFSPLASLSLTDISLDVLRVEPELCANVLVKHCS